MPWALPGAPPSDGVPGSATGELNVTFGVDSNQDVLETALDISRRFAKCVQRRQEEGLAARKSAEPSEWQDWKIEVQTRKSALAELKQTGRKVCRTSLTVQVNVSRATSSFEHPDLPLAPRATPEELKAAAKLKRNEPEAHAAAKLKRNEPAAKAAAKLALLPAPRPAGLRPREHLERVVLAQLFTHRTEGAAGTTRLANVPDRVCELQVCGGPLPAVHRLRPLAQHGGIGVVARVRARLGEGEAELGRAVRVAAPR
mmetsp:Transcript_36502/g.90543  ORF Transcript_36502/g.90543 Transcript_36502/m.90543 type:complete len:257 (+) Transcript_36502:1815-2585(+)